jgi:AcrR family transcriptional regulator
MSQARVPRSRYNVRTPNRILDVAARLFAERGYAGVALKDIVKAARVNGAAVNYHFGDKRNLYRKVIERGLRTREEAAPLESAAGAGLSAEERLHAFIHNLMIQLLDDSASSTMSRLMLREAIEPTAAFARTVDELPKRQLSILDTMVVELLRGERSHTRVRRISLSILGQCVYYRYAEKILRRTDPRLRYTRPVVHSIADHIYAFSLAAIRGMDIDHDRT